MKKLLFIYFLGLGCALNAQNFAEDWQKVASNTFDKKNLHLKMNYVVSNRYTSEIVENYLTEMVRFGNKVYTNSFGKEFMNLDKYAINIDHSAQTISIFKSLGSPAVDATLKKEKFVEMVNDFAKSVKISVAPTSDKTNKIRRYIITQPNAKVDRVVIEFDLTTYTLTSLQYFYSPIRDQKVQTTRNFILTIKFEVLPVGKFDFDINSYVDIQSNRVVPRAKYAKYQVINHLL